MRLATAVFVDLVFVIVLLYEYFYLQAIIFVLFGFVVDLLFIVFVCVVGGLV